ncbi:unnamed protein product [Cylindrotheca closterium]|uniref:Suppressor of forked domain-containing protein n=1 Tax=Cylindrotheca closterium TaxID=2856 RepID=A0AAD2JNY2_9STRA|nr:unnamed protein product [Cylindrotheca closterium]
MATDPRKRNGGAASNILLGGEDAMDEDEILDANVQATPIVEGSVELISTIITPSPFAHHVTGPTSSRFRNAMQRISENPTSDTEAWEALITEVLNCYRIVQPKIHNVDAEVQLQLDWMESCFGALLKYFPYSSNQYVAVAQMLFAQSARIGEEEGAAYGSIDRARSERCQRKLENIFSKTLGINMDGSPSDPDDPIGGMCTSNIELWLLYVRTRSRQARREHPGNPEIAREWTSNAYEIAIEAAGFCVNNHVVWKAYLAYAKAQMDNPKQMLHLRSIYQRLVCNPMTGLDQLWQEYEAFERQQSEALAAALVSEFTPKYQHARSVYLERNRVFNIQDLQINAKLASPPPSNEEDEDYTSKLQEDYQYLNLWKTRSAYERTNPERLTQTDLAKRTRQGYKEMACALTHHPEVWHMWCMWEETADASGTKAIAVLETGRQHIPDCTLLAHAQAQLTELHNPQPQECLKVMESFLEVAPSTLGFSLYQQMVRRYKGVKAARDVFAKARRVLVTEVGSKESVKSEGTEGADVKQEDDAGEKRWMVTNRLDPSIGKRNPVKEPSKMEEDSQKLKPGPITWHLYASHATIEHRLNKSPDIAARVYELGLRKHASFLIQPAYVLGYANLLLELQDTVNLRALLTRALTACKELDTSAVTALWDMTLKFESLMSIADPGNVKESIAIERKRRAALMGPEIEDVCNGARVGVGEAATIGAQKSTVAEQLVRTDGYEMSSMIVNGLSRSVEVLNVMGLWGSGAPNSSNRVVNTRTMDDDEVIPGGKSDALYQKRLTFASITSSGGSVETVGENSKILSARERLQASATPQGSAISIAIQQSPDWLRELLLVLPASKSQLRVFHKPSPFAIESALNALRQNKLPAERPQDGKKNGQLSGNKHRLQSGGGESSDEEDSGVSNGGYGFRDRQQARQMKAAQSIKSE